MKTTPTQEAVRLHGAPDGQERSPDYSVTINGVTAFVHTARASARAVGEWWPGNQRSLNETELASYVHFDLHGRAAIEVTYHHDILRWVNVKPERHGVEARIERRDHNRGVFSLTIYKPGVYVCEVDTIHYPLYIIANPPEEGAPERPAPPHRRRGGRSRLRRGGRGRQHPHLRARHPRRQRLRAQHRP